MFSEDNLGKVEQPVESPISDKGAKLVAERLKKLGYEARSYSSGRLEGEEPVPFVEIVFPEVGPLVSLEEKAARVAEKLDLAAEVQRKNLESNRRLRLLVAEFYEKRRGATPFAARLEVRIMNDGSVRLEPGGAWAQPVIGDEKLKAANLDLYRKEMNEFAEFLELKLSEGGMKGGMDRLAGY
jgi:hypothetical protein